MLLLPLLLLLRRLLKKKLPSASALLGERPACILASGLLDWPRWGTFVQYLDIQYLDIQYPDIQYIGVTEAPKGRFLKREKSPPEGEVEGEVAKGKNRMASFNRVVLMGNLTRDPELRYISTGTAVSEIGLAVNDRVKKGDQWVDEATFVDVTLWGRTAEVANEYLSKGSNILIEGRLKYDTWEKDGQKRSKLRVVAEKMQMVGGGGGGSQGGGPQQSYSGAPAGNAPAANAPSANAPSGNAPSGNAPSGNAPTEAPAPSMPPSDEIPF